MIRSVSILVPLYNEEEFVQTILERVLEAPLAPGLSREIVVVDDASTDGSAEIVERLAAADPECVRLIRHEVNQGKGAAVRTAIGHARGDVCIIQDADLEYDPNEYPKLLKPLVDGKADAVFGSRFMISGERRVLYYWHSVANKILTGLCNAAADLNLTDMETCYKAVRTSLLQSIPIRSDRFGIEPELTIKLARRRARIYETPISYHGRTYDEGKKIGIKDAFQAVWVIARYAFTNDLYSDSGPSILHEFAAAPRFNRWMADTVRPFVGGQVLEIGAGIGNLTRQLIARRKRYFATDLETEHLARLQTRFQHRPNIRIRRCDLTNPADFDEFAGEMDTVVCLNVLEHVADDLLGLANICKALRQGGHAIILVPHGQEIYGRLDEVLGHYRRYSHEELRGKMEQAGFRVQHVLEFNRVSRPAWYIQGRLLKRTSLGRFRMRMFDKTVWFWRAVDRYFPWKPTSIIAIGQKV
jgi:glycosyltransferase involved in cell wall biosynthesis/phospholipid N-methyltransferase